MLQNILNKILKLFENNIPYIQRMDGFPNMIYKNIENCMKIIKNKI